MKKSGKNKIFTDLQVAYIACTQDSATHAKISPTRFFSNFSLFTYRLIYQKKGNKR